jgi:proteasome accessory factor A
VIVGDSNMSEYTTLLKVGTTDLILRMLEEGQTMRDLTIENPIRAIREISHDLTFSKQIRLTAGREMTALDIQEAYLEKVAAFCERRGLDPVRQQILEDWAATLDALRKDELDRLDGKLDWVTKRNLIEAFRSRDDLPLSHPKVALLDLAYHDVTRTRGLAHLLSAKGRMDRVVTDGQIEDATEIPPQTTRARLRGEFIKKAKARRRDFTVDWVHLKLNDQAQRTVLCKDPFRAHDERVERLISSM